HVVPERVGGGPELCFEAQVGGGVGALGLGSGRHSDLYTSVGIVQRRKADGLRSESNRIRRTHSTVKSRRSSAIGILNALLIRSGSHHGDTETAEKSPCPLSLCGHDFLDL